MDHLSIDVPGNQGAQLMRVRLDDQHWIIHARCNEGPVLIRLPFTYSNAGLGWLLKMYSVWGIPTRALLADWARRGAKK